MKKHSLFINGVSILIMLLLVIFIQGNGFSQDNQNPKMKQQQNPQTLTVEQKALIKSILSKYNASTLTADQAKAIHEKFREAGIHGGPETKDAIIAAGFDPEKLRSLAPPPANDKKGDHQPPTIEERLKMIEEKVVNPLSLNTDQKGKVIFAFKDFYTEVDKLMKAQSNPQERLDKSKVEPFAKARDEKIKLVLSKDQFIKYLELEKTTRPPRPEDNVKEK